MKGILKKMCHALLIGAMILSLFPAVGFAADEDFSEHFTSVTITDSDGNPFTSPIAQNASIKITCAYTLQSNISKDDTHYFDIPTLVAPSSDLPGIGKDEDTGETIFTFIVKSTGRVEVAFTAFAEDNHYLELGETGFIEIETTLDPVAIVGGGVMPLRFFEGSSNEKLQNVIFAFDQITAGGLFSYYDAVPTPATSSVAWSFDFEPTLSNIFPVSGDDKITDLVFTIDLGDLAFEATGSDAGLTGSGTLGAFAFDDSITGQLTCTIANYTYAAGDIITVNYNTTYDLGAFKDSDTASFDGSVSAAFRFPKYTMDSAGVVSLDSETQTALVDAVETNADVTAAFLDKTQVLNSSNMQITWTVVVNANAVPFTDGTFIVKDNIPEKLNLISVTLDSATISSPGGYTYDGDATYSGGLLSVSVSSNAKHTIVYVTEIDPAVWKGASNRDFENEVSYTATYNGEGYGFYRSKTAKGIFAGDGGGLISGAGSYNRTNHTITWTFGINDYDMLMTNGKVEITIPDGLTYTGISYSGSLASSSADTSVSGKVTVTLPSPISADGKIILTAMVDDVALWGTNAANTTKNMSAKLTTSEGVDLTVNPGTTIVTKVIEKSATGYNFAAKEITWKLTINQNKMAMSGIVISDTLPEGLSFVAGSEILENVALKSAVDYDPATCKLTVEINDLVAADDKTYTITFNTLVAESQRQTATTVSNTAYIKFDELGVEPAVSSTATRSIGAAALLKSGTQDSLYRTFTWTVGINTNENSLPAPIIEDTLPAGLLMDLESVQLFECTVNSNGTLSTGTKVYDGETPVATNGDYSAAVSGQLFTFTFNNPITKAYRLVFITDNLSTSAAAYSNTVNFKNESPDPLSGSGAIPQTAAASGGTSNPKRGSITLKATQANGTTPIAGITYTLTGSNPNNVYTAVTDANGIAFFNPVKFDTYTITQNTGIPAGMGLMAALPIIAVDSSAKNPVPPVIRHDDAANIILLNYDGNGGTGVGYATEFCSSGDPVLVKGNPFTRTGYTFNGWNTAANGSGTAYAVNDTFSITASTTLYAVWLSTGGSSSSGSGDTTVTAPVVPSVLLPVDPVVDPPVKPLPATNPSDWAAMPTANVSAATSKPLAAGKGGLILSAVSINGVSVPGVVFQIESNGAVITQITGKDGLAVFRDIEPGQYVVTVLSVPAGYEFDFDSVLVLGVSEASYEVREAIVALSSNSPKTGDSFPLEMIWAVTIACFVIIAGLGYIALRRKKRSVSV